MTSLREWPAVLKITLADVQNPVYMVFACLVADQDLLFCLYDVPCISICRAEQRPKALERLGLPNTVYREIEERGGGHVVAPLPANATTTNNAAENATAANGDDPDMRGMDTIWTAIARQTTQANSTPLACCATCLLLLANASEEILKGIAVSKQALEHDAIADASLLRHSLSHSIGLFAAVR